MLDMIDVGLLDAPSPARFPSVLDSRLQELLDTSDSLFLLRLAGNLP
ncbi:MAG: hypothetical protein IT427_06875 [Pirellulales bacterium]|nr:hypothetical protein [Pirellulales bacterium]